MRVGVDGCRAALMELALNLIRSYDEHEAAGRWVDPISRGLWEAMARDVCEKAQIGRYSPGQEWKADELADLKPAELASMLREFTATMTL